ncbi:MAG: hypothetical protein QOE35_2445 [Actinomycetota bacterium]
MGTSEPIQTGLHGRRRTASLLLLIAVAWVATIFGAGRASAQEATSDATATPAASAQKGGGGDGVTVAKSNTKITSEGSGQANTGSNTLNGNESVNTADNDQNATTDGNRDAVLSNSADTKSSSNGSATLTTGDAKGSGSESNTNVEQAIFAGGGVNTLDQRAIVVSDGDGSADTGNNDVTGNASINDASTDQRAIAETGSIHSNIADTTNDSDGSAGVTTGDADATGNKSVGDVGQWATVVGNGTGGVSITDQSARISNDGDADANTGGNTAVGNLSDNVSSTDQRANSARGPPRADIVLTNIATTTNSSDGSADINTGMATANGNDSNTTITQASTTALDNGLAFPDQRIRVRNEGEARATTGNNTGVGNASFNDADTRQRAGVFGDDIRARDVVATNIADTTNRSDGAASITTGEACANGNTSSTQLDQHADAAVKDGFTFIDQRANLSNTGDGTADTGRNRATGNVSVNLADTRQRSGLFATPAAGGARIRVRDLLATNIADTTNRSDGSASVTTGAATACGNVTNDRVAQAAGFDNDPGFAFIDQRARISNDGDAVASTGRNRATGNDSFNDAATRQRAGAFARGGNDTDVDLGIGQGIGIGIGTGGNARIDLRDVTATAIATTANESNGSASISTGEAMASGNFSSSALSQDAGVAIAGDGFAFVDQRGRVTNDGDGTADTGRNRATGNNSVNDVNTNQRTGAFAQGGNGTGVGIGIGIGGPGIGIGIGTGGNARIDARDLVATAIADTSNSSDGSAGINTGSATAYGSYATTAVDQTAPVAIGGKGFAFVDQATRVNNDGDAVASTGRNRATGNNSANDADTNQRTGLFANGGDGTGVGVGIGLGGTGFGLGIGTGGNARIDARDVTSTAIADNSNSSDGLASITTGSATAYGNYATTTVNDGQVADIAIGGDGFTFVDQLVRVTNTGDSTADTGRNRAIGNNSENDASTNQRTGLFANGGDGTGAGIGVGLGGTGIGIGIGLGGNARTTADDVLATSFTTNANNSDGAAGISTGSATAYGNYATTAVDQTAPVTIDGDGFAIVDQNVRVTNDGDAVASTGRNRATGNNSDNDASTDQRNGLFANGGDGTGFGLGVGIGGIRVPSFGIGVGAGVGGNARATADDVTSASFSDNSNASDGLASITTGSATAYGNYASTAINSGQVADVAINGKGFTTIDQRARVTNDGDGTADTGRNRAIGNNSENDADTNQRSGLFSNAGDGTGVGIGIAIDIGNGAFGIGIGVGIGGNARTQADDVIATGFADTNNNSDGSAGIVTGAATAYGNVSDTAIDQVATVDIIDSGFSTIDQRSRVRNEGEGTASTGRNLAIGNNSVNDADTDQTAGLFADGGNGTGVGIGLGLGGFGFGLGIGVGGNATVVTGGDLLATNFADTGSNSDGSATVETGSALARGNYSATNVVQAVHDPAALELFNQQQNISNVGDANADTGKNDALANNSDNDADNDQRLGTFANGGNANAIGIGFPFGIDIEIAGNETLRSRGDNVLVNNADTTNNSDGTTSIRTGAAVALGNVAVTSACSGINVDVDCPVATLPRIVPPPPPPPCPCRHQEVTPPVAVPPVTVVPPVVPNVPELPVTGGPLAAQAVLGLLLVVLGAALRRRKAQLA